MDAISRLRGPLSDWDFRGNLGGDLIDLHCHLLPGLDDGPATLAEALALARVAVSQDITVIACTPHILPGVYDNTPAVIRQAKVAMQSALDDAGIAITLVAGADVHMVPDNVARLRTDAALSLADSRYVLIEPPHHVLPPRAEHAFFDLAAAGYVPLLTHPERMTWIEQNYAFCRRLAHAGVLMQLTAAAFTGGFGRRSRYWAERMLDDDLVDVVATDAHHATRRPPLLRDAYEAVSRRVGEERTNTIFMDNPRAILDNGTIAPRATVSRPSAADRAGAFKVFSGMSLAWMRRS